MSNGNIWVRGQFIAFVYFACACYLNIALCSKSARHFTRTKYMYIHIYIYINSLTGWVVLFSLDYLNVFILCLIVRSMFFFCLTSTIASVNHSYSVYNFSRIKVVVDWVGIFAGLPVTCCLVFFCFCFFGKNAHMFATESFSPDKVEFKLRKRFRW